MEHNKKKVLVIDDDKNLTMVLVDKLKLSGFEATSAGDGEEGLKMALESHPDLILLDLMMPKKGGLDMLKELRVDSWGKHAKVLVLTLLEQMDSMAEATEDNALGYFVKTNHTLDEIIEKIQSVTGSSNEKI